MGWLWLTAPQRSWLRQAARILASVFLADQVARLCGLGEAGWALITAVIVTSNSVTGTLSAGRDQVVGTVIGAMAGAIAIALTLDGWPKMPVFALLLAPLALLAAIRPTLRLTCITLVVVFLFPSPGNPFERPLDRVAAILIGAFSGLVVSYLVFRSRARASAFAAASGMLATSQELLREVMQGDGTANRDRLAEAANAGLRSLADAVMEARREHFSALEEVDPLLVRLLPMMRRLQSDVLFVARALDELPDAPSRRAALQPTLAALEPVFASLRAGCDAAVAGGREGDEVIEAAAHIGALDQALAKLGDIAGVPLRFTLQMLRRDLDDTNSAIVDAQSGAP